VGGGRRASKSALTASVPCSRRPSQRHAPPAIHRPTSSLLPAALYLPFPRRRQTDSEGRKFGKSTGGAIWLTADKLSPYKFYQYLFGVTDADVIKLLRMLTFLPLEEVAALEASMKQVGQACPPPIKSSAQGSFRACFFVRVRTRLLR
jgi:hypothetical protein